MRKAEELKYGSIHRAALGILASCSISASPLLIYVLLWFAPGDPALSSLGIYATPEQLEDPAAQQLDLDKPIYVLYVRWLGQIIRGDFGVSLITKEYVSTSNWAQSVNHHCN